MVSGARKQHSSGLAAPQGPERPDHHRLMVVHLPSHTWKPGREVPASQAVPIEAGPDRRAVLTRGLASPQLGCAAVCWTPDRKGAFPAR